MARRELPIGDPAYDHFAKCSPCYVELRTIQQADAAIAAAATRRRRQLLAAAAVLVLAVAAAWFALRGPGGREATSQSSGEFVQQTSLDLRPFSVTRSEQRANEPAALVLPRGRLNVVILLPVGAEPGAYELQIVDSDSQSRTMATGTATIRNYVTTFEAALELGSLGPGEYKLALRRQGADWRTYPVVIR